MLWENINLYTHDYECLICCLLDSYYWFSSFSLVIFIGALKKDTVLCCYSQLLLFVFTCPMDPFDDDFPEAPVARARVGGKFIPKVKSKQLPRKEISTTEHATSCNDEKSENVASSSTSSDAVGNIPNKYSNPVDLTPDTSANITIPGPGNDAPDTSPIELEIPISDNITNPGLGNDALHSTIAASEVNGDWNSSNFSRAANEADSVGYGVGLEEHIIPGTDLHNGEGQFLDGNKSLEPINTSLQVGPDVESQRASDYKLAMLENIHSNFNFERAVEVESGEYELDPFRNRLRDSGLRNARKFQPKIKPRPRVGTAVDVASASSNEILRTTDTSNDYTSVPFSEDKRSLGAVIPSQSDSSNAMLPEVAVHNGPRDWPSSSGKSAGESADIFSVLEGLNDFVTQPATSTEKLALHSFHEKGTEAFVGPACSTVNSSIFGACDTAQVQKCPNYNTTQDSLIFKEGAVFNEVDSHTNNGRSGTEEVAGLNPACPLDDTFDYSSIKSGPDTTFEIPVHEELTNAADSSTFDDFLPVEDAPGGNDPSEKEKDATMSSSPKNHRKSSVAGEKDKVGKPSRQLRKRAPRIPVDPAENEDAEEEDELDPTYNSKIDEVEEHELDNVSRKKRAPSSKKKSIAKNGKPPQKRKKANEDVDRPTKEPPKKFSHSTRRRKRCVDKALLETPEDELDPQTLHIRDIILLAEYRERIAKKEAATSKTSSINERDGGSFHDAAAYNEDILGSEDGRDSDDDQASERVPLASALFNYQSFMNKAPSGKWSKQDTELFYEAVRQFGTDFSMIQQLFPGRTRHQIKLKYKKEERQHPLQLSDVVNNRGKDLSHFKSVIERLQQASAKAEQDPVRDASDGMIGEEVEDLTPDTNEEKVAKSEQDAAVQDEEDNGPFAEKSDESDDDDFQRWCQYKSDY